MLRRKEICDLQQRDWDPTSGCLTIRTSKTDQVGRGAAYTLSQETSDAVNAWCDASGLTDISDEAEDGRMPLFAGVLKNGALRRMKQSGIAPLAGKSVARMLDAHAQRAGIHGVSGHTVRRSIARQLQQAGAGDEDIVDAGRWTSVDVMRRYVGLAVTRRSAGDLLTRTLCAA